MKKYRVEIKYIHHCYVDVEAKDKRGAMAQAKQYIKNCSVVEFAQQDRIEHEIVVNECQDETER